MSTPATRAAMRFHLLTTWDDDAWRAALPAELNVMGSVAYARILERQTGYPARLLVVEASGCRVAYPFLLRPLRSLAFARPAQATQWDTLTPEYTGPIWRDPADARALPLDALAAPLRELGVVAEFAHLNPWDAALELLDPRSLTVNRDVVALDLAKGEARIWAEELSSDARRQTKQAWKAGVAVRRATSLDDVRAFHDLYLRTMARRHALARYQFPLEHFVAFHETMRDHAFFVLAEHGGRLAAGGLFLHGGMDLYWHLSAADLALGHVRPVNAYLHDTIRWAVRAGKRRMLLGGGYAPDDGIFRFKAAFSRQRLPFRVYRRVHDPDAYRSLAEAWSAHHGRPPVSDFFPSYRAHPPDTASVADVVPAAAPAADAVPDAAPGLVAAPGAAAPV